MSNGFIVKDRHGLYISAPRGWSWSEAKGRAVRTPDDKSPELGRRPYVFATHLAAKRQASAFVDATVIELRS